MFNKKKQELSTEDAPDSIAPWEMLDEDRMANVAEKLRKHYPDKNYAPVARRIDNDLRVCFDKGPEGIGKSVVIVHELGGAVVKSYNGFIDWFDEAVAESRGQ
jgi:hypothetical protein